MSHTHCSLLPLWQGHLWEWISEKSGQEARSRPFLWSQCHLRVVPGIAGRGCSGRKELPHHRRPQIVPPECAREGPHHVRGRVTSSQPSRLKALPSRCSRPSGGNKQARRTTEFQVQGSDVSSQGPWHPSKVRKDMEKRACRRLGKNIPEETKCKRTPCPRNQTGPPRSHGPVTVVAEGPVRGSSGRAGAWTLQGGADT